MIHWWKGKRRAMQLAKKLREMNFFLMAELLELYGRWFVWRRMKKLKALRVDTSRL